MAGKMDKTTKIVVAVVGSLGILSTIMGFSAEGTKLTVSWHRHYSSLVNVHFCGGVCVFSC
jgi:fluoride ion exporter CrcB/FEX